MLWDGVVLPPVELVTDGRSICKHPIRLAVTHIFDLLERRL
jgi:hypothetical protein